jgi:hypothetical protein
MGGTCTKHERNKKCIQNIRKLEGKRPFRRPRSKWEDNIRMDIKRNIFEGVDWINPVAGSCEHDSEPSGSVKDGQFLD